MKLGIITFLVLIYGSFLYGQKSLTIEIDEFRNSKEGNILIAIFTDQLNFTNDISFKNWIVPKEKLINGVFKETVKLPLGEYGIAILDDEDINGKMSYNFFGIPKEGYGFSDFNHSGFKKPMFSDFKFSVSDSTDIIRIKLRYL
jgi:uncharacterized protein (DUF2141 family)|tara:strand:+ start:2122 stop:2553 length:432 start_codon:yes stop_codon:yes gene_type:complete